MRWTCEGLGCNVSKEAIYGWCRDLKNSILYEIQLLDELVVGSFEPPDACAACDSICRHFAYESYLLKVW
jgi:hypothetical protein